MDIDKTINPRGSITIEASLIFPFILLILMITIYIIIYAHEMACLQSLANSAVLEIQKYYQDSNYSDRIERNLYFDGLSEEAISEHVINLVNQGAKEQLLIKDRESLQVEIKKQSYLIYQKFELSIKKDVSIPIKRLDNWINISCNSSIPMKAVVKTKYFQPTECIRGMDFVDDLTSEIEVVKPIKSKYNSILEKIENTINEWI